MSAGKINASAAALRRSSDRIDITPKTKIPKPLDHQRASVGLVAVVTEIPEAH
jgi:hypothetical protein